VTDNEMYDCGDIQTMSHIINCCLQRLHTADEAAVDWLMSYGTWTTYTTTPKLALKLLENPEKPTISFLLLY